MKTVCGLDCGECGLRDSCGEKQCGNCGSAFAAPHCMLKERLIAEFNALGIEDMEEVTELHALHGAYINLQYTLPGGQAIRFWNDDRIYLGNQICKKNSDRCYGLTADEQYLLVCEYGAGGSDAEIIIYEKWR